MLVLSRRVGEKILIGDDIEVVVLSTNNPKNPTSIKIGINAPASVNILREEVKLRNEKANNSDSESRKEDSNLQNAKVHTKTDEGRKQPRSSKPSTVVPKKKGIDSIIDATATAVAAAKVSE